MPDDPRVTRDPERIGTAAERRAATRGMSAQDRADLESPSGPVDRQSFSPVIERVKGRGHTARVVAGTMAFATLFALLSDELAAVAGTKGKGSNGVRILFGGAVATVILLFINEAGEAGATLAEGLAVTTAVVVTLVNGKPVWDWLGKVTGSHPTAAPTTPTGPSGESPGTLPGSTGATAPTTRTGVTR